MFNRRYAYDYIYDKIGRIQEARNNQTGRSETFAFDPAHNILDIPTSTPSPVGEGKTTAPISDDPKTQGRLKSPANPNPVSGNRLKEYNGIEYTYDALGNLIYRQLPNGENQYYQYDLENQLVRAEIKKPAGNTEIWTYAYDPFGRRLSKERQDKLVWTSTEPKRTHFVWDGTRLLQEYTYKGSYTYIYTDQDSYEPLAQVFDNAKDGKQYLAYFHTDQIGIPKEMTDIHGNLLWYGEYTAWGRLKKDGRVYKDAHQPFRLQNQYYDEETGLHYNLFRYYEPEAGRFVNQDPIGLLGGENLYSFAPNVQAWMDVLGLCPRNKKAKLRRKKAKKANARKSRTKITELERTRGASNVHSLDRHGAQTSLAQQLDRANNAPNGITPYKSHAARFTSHQDHLDTLNTALDRRSRGLGQQTPQGYRDTFDMGRPVAEGFRKDSSNLVRTSEVTATFNSSGQLVSLFGKVN